MFGSWPRRKCGAAAFYPGIYPLANGGIAEVAGALCYFIVIVIAHAFSDGNKRTGAIAAAAFLAINGFELKFPFDRQREKHECFCR